MRIELYIDTGKAEENKRIFDRLFAKRKDIELSVGATLNWERLDKRRASRIALYREGGIEDDEQELGNLRSWAVENATRLHNTFSPLMEEIL